LQDVLPLEDNLAAVRFQKAQDEFAGGRLAAARLTHQPKGFPPPQSKGDSVHSLQFAAGPTPESGSHSKGFAQIAYFQQVFHYLSQWLLVIDDLQLSAFSFQFSAYSLQLTAYSLQLTACSLQLAACSLQLAACSLQLAAYSCF
jgi:hypothetical protein